MKKNLKKELEKAELVSKEYLETLQRVQAEFENYVKRIGKEKEEFKEYAKHELISKLLSIIDDFEKAIEVIKDEETKKGVKMIYDSLSKVLENEGVRVINAVGESFDPYKHDVIEKVDGEKNDVIVEEVKRGYQLKNKILRPSLVKVSKVKEEKNE